MKPAASPFYSPRYAAPRVSLADAAAKLSAAHPFTILIDEGDEIVVELYAPVGDDRQQPHTRDELYIVATGTGTFRRDGELVPFVASDLLYVPAFTPHRFETFSEDFRTWVIFYGRERLPDGDGATD